MVLVLKLGNESSRFRIAIFYVVHVDAEKSCLEKRMMQIDTHRKVKKKKNTDHVASQNQTKYTTYYSFLCSTLDISLSS